MLIRLTSGSLALLAFSVAILAGLSAGNNATTILVRAWWAMMAFLALGAVVGWIARTVIDERAKSQQAEIDGQQQTRETEDADAERAAQNG